VRRGHGDQIRRGLGLFKRFKRFDPDRIRRVGHPRVLPPVLVELGELRGLIYGSDRWDPGRKRSFIHFMETPPLLLSNPEGNQLFIVGGRYRVTSRGIEG
jgi:hypothetical protein